MYFDCFDIVQDADPHQAIKAIKGENKREEIEDHLLYLEMYQNVISKKEYVRNIPISPTKGTKNEVSERQLTAN